MSRTAQKVLDAALRMFSLYGYGPVTMGQIAAEAGLSRQALYGHFADKDSIFRGVVVRLHAQSIEASERAAQARADDGPAERLHALFDQRFSALHDLFHGTAHGSELVSEGNRLCGEENRAATQRFITLVDGVIRDEAARGRLDLAKVELSGADLAQLLLRGVYGLKGDLPAPLPPAEFRIQLRRFITLLALGLAPP